MKLNPQARTGLSNSTILNFFSTVFSTTSCGSFFNSN